MKAFTKLMAMMILPFILTACIGSSSTNKTETTPDTTPPPSPDLAYKLNMRAAIYQAFRNYSGYPSGTLTLTTDSVDSDVHGKYSVIKDGALVSAGTVSGSTSKLSLFSSYTSVCKEKLTIYPLSTTEDSTKTAISKVFIYGENCAGQPVTATEYLKKITGLSSIVAKSRLFVQNNLDMTISASTADDITFLGTLSLNNANTELSPLDKTVGAERKTATATVVGFSTYSSNNTVRSVKDGVNYVQLKVTNFSGHLFSPADVLTFPDNATAPQTYIRFKPAADGYEIDKFNVYITDLTQSILLGNDPSDSLTSTLMPYTPL